MDTIDNIKNEKLLGYLKELYEKGENISDEEIQELDEAIFQELLDATFITPIEYNEEKEILYPSCEFEDIENVSIAFTDKENYEKGLEYIDEEIRENLEPCVQSIDQYINSAKFGEDFGGLIVNNGPEFVFIDKNLLLEIDEERSKKL